MTENFPSSETKPLPANFSIETASEISQEDVNKRNNEKRNQVIDEFSLRSFWSGWECQGEFEVDGKLIAIYNSDRQTGNIKSGYNYVIIKQNNIE